jgi:cell shape-determining protein MreC
MISRQKNRSRFKALKVVGVIFVFLLILRFFNNPIVVHLFNYPVNYVLNSTSGFSEPFKHAILYFKDKDDLQIRINELEQENLEFKLNQIVQQSNAQEFEYFVNTFGVTPQHNTVLLKVITRPPFMSFDLLRITGDLNPYQVNDFVYYKDILIGKLIEKNNIYGTVELFSSPDQKTPVIVRGSQFEAIGLGAGRYMFEVANNFEVVEKDVILFSEQHANILGVVTLIDARPEDLFKKVYFNIPIELSELSYVSIGKPRQYEQQTTNTN